MALSSPAEAVSRLQPRREKATTSRPMNEPINFYILMFLPPFLIALVAQFFLSSRRRAKLIASVGLGWVAAVLFIPFVGALASELGVFGAMVGVAIFGIIALVLALGGAIAGSELATFVLRTLGKSRA
jgi:peptidoglycan/LPS O-acetylase OafA/YrhL